MKIVSMFQNILFYKRGFTKDFLEISDEYSGRWRIRCASNKSVY